MNKIYQDINESNIYIQIGSYKFYFSSDFLKEKFLRLKDNFIKEESLKLNNRYEIELNCTDYLLISLYKKVEKRGFKVYFSTLEIKPDVTYYVKMV